MYGKGWNVAEVCNWVFYAASAVLLYYLIVGAARWLFWRPQVVARRRAAAATTAVLALLAIAGIPSARGEETPRIDVEVVHPGPPVIVPDDVLIRPYDLQADGGISPSDRLLVPYAKYVELWNRAHPDKKLSQGKPPPLPFAWAGASYAATLEGDESLLLAGRLAIDVFCEGYAVVPMELRGGVLVRVELDGRPARLRLAGFSAEPQPKTAPPNNALAALCVEGKGRHSLEVEIRVKLSRQGGWRVAEAALPAAPATSLAITAPAAGTEIRLSQVRDCHGYETERDGKTIHTTLGGNGELALQWRPKVAEGQVDRGLTSQSAAVLDVQEDGLRLIWDLSLEFRRSQRERFVVNVPRKFLVEKVIGGNVRGWEVRNADKDQTVEVSLLKPAKDHERFALRLWRSGVVGRGELAEFDAPLVSAAGVAQAGGELTICRSPLLDLRTVRSNGAARADLSGDLLATATESPWAFAPIKRIASRRCPLRCGWPRRRWRRRPRRKCKPCSGCRSTNGRWKAACCCTSRTGRFTASNCSCPRS